MFCTVTTWESCRDYCCGHIDVGLRLTSSDGSEFAGGFVSMRCIAMNVYHNCNTWLAWRRYDFDEKQVARKLNYCNNVFWSPIFTLATFPVTFIAIVCFQLEAKNRLNCKCYDRNTGREDKLQLVSTCSHPLKKTESQHNC